MPASYVTEKESINGPFIIKSYGNVDLSWETLFLEWSHSHLLLIMPLCKLREMTLSPFRLHFFGSRWTAPCEFDGDKFRRIIILLEGTRPFVYI